MINKRKLALSCLKPPGRSRLVGPDGINMESRRPTEDSGVSDRGKPDFETVGKPRIEIESLDTMIFRNRKKNNDVVVVCNILSLGAAIDGFSHRGMVQVGFLCFIPMAAPRLGVG